LEGENKANLEDDRPTGRSLYVVFIAEHDDERNDGEDDGRDKKRNPVTMITSDERSGNGSGGTQVDRGIEVQIDPLVGQGRADDDCLSGFQDLFPDLAGVLLSH